MFGLIREKTLVKALDSALSNARFFNNVNAYRRGVAIYPYVNQDDQVSAYASISDLYAIVNKIMKTAATIPIYEYRKKNDKAYGLYRTLEKKCLKNPNNKDLAKLYETKEAALELVGESGELQQLLDQPNEYQSKTEFYQLTYLFKLLTGNYYIFKNILEAGANMGKTYEMYNLPANYIKIIPTEELPRRAAAYEMNLYGSTLPIGREYVIHGKYVNPSFDFIGNELYGLSPLQPGKNPLSTTKNQADYQNEALINAGSRGAVYSEDAAEMEETARDAMKEKVLDDLGSKWKGGKNINARKLAFLSGKWGYLDLMKSPADMDLIEQQKLTFKQLCNIYGVPDELFNGDAGAKYDNQGYAEKSMYTNCCLPLVAALCDDFNRGLAPAYKGSIVGYDLNDIPELQENVSDINKRFSEAPGYKPNDLREATGYGRDLGPDGEVFLVKTGYQPLADVAAPIDIPMTGDYQNNLP